MCVVCFVYITVGYGYGGACKFRSGRKMKTRENQMKIIINYKRDDEENCVFLRNDKSHGALGFMQFRHE